MLRIKEVCLARRAKNKNEASTVCKFFFSLFSKYLCVCVCVKEINNLNFHVSYEIRMIILLNR